MTRPRFNYHWIEEGKILAGSIPTCAQDIAQLRSMGIGGVLTLTRRAIGDCPGISKALEENVIENAQAPIPDHGIATDDIMMAAVGFIDRHYKNNVPIYVHCRGGIGRTGCILIAFYVLKEGLSLQEARELMKRRRNYEGNAHAGAQGQPQRSWIDALPKRLEQMKQPPMELKSKKKPITGIRALNQVLKQIAEDFDLDGKALVKYAREDKLLGKDDGNQYGTAYTVEGKLLYALVRVLRPAQILEVGTYHGGSAAHLALGCQANDLGQVTTIDIWEGAGVNVPKSLKPYITLVLENVDFYLSVVAASGILYDFIFEDGAHSEHQVHNIYQALPYILRPGGLILSHDTATGVGEYIRNGMKKGGVNLAEVKFYEIPPSPCGLSVYRFEGY